MYKCLSNSDIISYKIANAAWETDYLIDLESIFYIDDFFVGIQKLNL